MEPFYFHVTCRQIMSTGLTWWIKLFIAVKDCFYSIFETVISPEASALKLILKLLDIGRWLVCQYLSSTASSYIFRQPMYGAVSACVKGYQGEMVPSVCPQTTKRALLPAVPLVIIEQGSGGWSSKLKLNPPFHAWYLPLSGHEHPVFKNCYFWAAAPLSSVYSTAAVEIQNNFLAHISNGTFENFCYP